MPRFDHDALQCDNRMIGGHATRSRPSTFHRYYARQTLLLLYIELRHCKHTLPVPNTLCSKMQLKFTLFTSLCLALSALAATFPRSCSEQFGTLKVTPSSFAPKEQFSIDADFSCPLSQGVVPTVAEYYLQGISGSVPRLLLATSDLTKRFDKSFDSWTGTLPQGEFSKDEKYTIKMELGYSSSAAKSAGPGVQLGAASATPAGSVEVEVALKL